jgi:hypothetical protein
LGVLPEWRSGADCPDSRDSAVAGTLLTDLRTCAVLACLPPTKQTAECLGARR